MAVVHDDSVGSEGRLHARRPADAEVKRALDTDGATTDQLNLGEGHVPHTAVYSVRRAVITRTLQRVRRADADLRLTNDEVARLHPLPRRGEDAVVGRARQRAAVVEEELDALARSALHHRLDRTARQAGGVVAEAMDQVAAPHRLDGHRHALRQLHRRAFSDAERVHSDLEVADVDAHGLLAHGALHRGNGRGARKVSDDLPQPKSE